MILLVLTALAAVSSADKLDRTYLPPASAKTAGGSPGSLQPPLTNIQGLSLPKGSFTNDDQGVVVDAALSGTRSAEQQSGLGSPRPEYGSMASKVGDAAFRGSQNFIQPRPQAAKDKNSNILTYANNVDINNYNYGFETDNGIAVGENGIAHDGVQAQGGYSYKGDDGQIYSVTYTADKNGYKPYGSHLPTSPPIPDEILKSIEKNRKDEAAGLLDDGSYDVQKYNAEGDYSESDNKYNGAQQSQFDKRPESEMAANGAVINQNGFNAQPNLGNEKLGPDGKPEKGLISLALLGLLGSTIASAATGGSGLGGLGSGLGGVVGEVGSVVGEVGSVVGEVDSVVGEVADVPVQPDSIQGQENNQEVPVNEQSGLPELSGLPEQSVVPEQTNTENSRFGSLNKPDSQKFGSFNQPIGTTGHTFQQSPQNGNLNNQYLPPFSGGQNNQPNYNGQPQNPAFGFNTNRPFGSFGGFSNQPGNTPGQFGSSGFGSQPTNGNQQQILPSSFGPSKPASGFSGAQTGSNNFGSIPQQQSEQNLTPTKENDETQQNLNSNIQSQNQPTSQTQFGSQFPTQVQNVPLSGPVLQDFGSFNIQYRPPKGQQNQVGNSQQQPPTGFTQNDAFGSQSSPVSSQPLQGQAPFSNKPGFGQNAFGSQPQYQTGTQQLNQPLSGGQIPQSFQNGFNQNNAFNAQRPTNTFGQPSNQFGQPSTQFGQFGFNNKPQVPQQGFPQRGSFSSQKKPTPEPLQDQNSYSQSSGEKQPQNGFTQTFEQNKPMTSTQSLQNQANQANSGSKHHHHSSHFHKPSSQFSGSSQTTFGGQTETEYESSLFSDQQTVVKPHKPHKPHKQPQLDDQSYNYNQPNKPFNTPTSHHHKPSSAQKPLDDIQFPSTEDGGEYSSSTPKPGQQSDSQPIYNGVTQAAASPFPAKPTPSTQFGTFGRPQASTPQRPQNFQQGQQFPKPSSDQSSNINVNNRNKPEMQNSGDQNESNPGTYNPTNSQATQQYDGELYQYNKPDPVLAPETEGSSSDDKTSDSQPQFDQQEQTPSQIGTESSEPSKPTNQQLFGSTQQQPTAGSQSQFAGQPTKPFGGASQPGNEPSKPTFGQILPGSFPTSQPSQPFGAQPFKPFGSAPQFGTFPSRPQFGQNLPSSFPTAQPSQPQFGSQPLKPFGGSTQPSSNPGQVLNDQAVPSSFPNQPNRPQFGTQPFKPFGGSSQTPGQSQNTQTPSSTFSNQPNRPQFGTQPFKPFGSSQQPGSTPGQIQNDQILPGSFPNQPNRPQFGTQPFKPFGSFSKPTSTPGQPQYDQTQSNQQNRPTANQPFKPFNFNQPGSVPAKPQFDQTQSSSFPSSQPSQPQFGTQPFRPFGSASQPSAFPPKPILPNSFPNLQPSQPQFGAQPLKPIGQQVTPAFDQPQNDPLPSQTLQPSFGSQTQGAQPQFGNQEYKPFGSQTPSKPQFGQTQPTFSNNYNQQQFGSQNNKPFESQPAFGSNPTSLPSQPAPGQYNYQSQFPSSQFNQQGTFTGPSSTSFPFSQTYKPFRQQSLPSNQESQASSTATATGPSATASAHASTGSDPEEPKPAFKKACCKVVQSSQKFLNKDAENQGPKEDFKGPEQPQRFDEKTGYHY